MDYKAQTVYQSPETTPDGKPFMTVKKARDYYYYAERGGKDSIAFILYNANTSQVALISESKPPMDESINELVHMTTAFGGSVDMDLPLKEIVQIEVLEEAGYEVPLDKISFAGKTLVSSQMSQTMYGYVVDVTDIEKTKLAEYETPNATDEFNKNKVVWMGPDDMIRNADWKSIFISVMHGANQEGII